MSSEFVHGLLRGGAAGAVATVPMSAAMLSAQRLGMMRKLPPEKITESALEAADVPTTRDEKKALTTLAHFGYGAGCGALFATAFGKTRGSAESIALGLAFASLVWAGSYAGWIPALGILPPPTRDRPSRQSAMLVSHWVYGAALGLLVRRFTEQHRRI